MAWMAGSEDWHAKCLREKSARKRRARGSDSEQRVLRRARIVGSGVVGGGDVAEGAMAGSMFSPSRLVRTEKELCCRELGAGENAG